MFVKMFFHEIHETLHEELIDKMTIFYLYTFYKNVIYAKK